MTGRSRRRRGAPSGPLAPVSAATARPEVDLAASLLSPLPVHSTGGELSPANGSLAADGRQNAYRRAVSRDGEGASPGRLIVVEGIDGSGKSTQLDLLRKWLVNQGYLVIFSEWNSSPIVKGITRVGKRQQLLSPMSFSLIHAADLASRTYSQILPALQSGAVVLADRYVYTAYARDAVRGLNRAWLRRLYSFAVPPTLAFYFDVPLDEAMRRITLGRPELKFYEAGLDLGLSSDPYESFRRFQGLIRQEYECVVSEYGLLRLDATESLIHQQQRMREMVRPYLEGALRLPNPSPADSLHAAGRIGHQQSESRELAEPDE
ncbi:MAG: thymidylate kinase [Chloroflexi bacterium]|nr:thymidylate kinase [Chloroflexota bacterium]